jgi:hypothetical protein
MLVLHRLTAFFLILGPCKDKALYQTCSLISTVIINTIIIRHGRKNARCGRILIAPEILILGSSIRIGRSDSRVVNGTLNLNDINSKSQVIRIKSPRVGVSIPFSGNIDVFSLKGGSRLTKPLLI